MAGYIGSKASVVSSGAERKKTFAITTTTTVLSGLSYTPTFVHLFHNGVRLVDGTDYTATDGTSITLTSAAESGDEVVVISYATFQAADAYTKAEADSEFVSDPNGAVTVDGSGNVGIGVVPKAGGSVWQHVQFGGTGNLIARKADANVDSMFANNYYVNASNVDSYTTTGPATRVFLNDNTFAFDQAASGAADAAISWSTAMTIDSSGNVGIGTSSPTSKVHLQNVSGGSGGYLKVTDAVYGGDVRFGMADGVDNDAIVGVWSNNNVKFYTNSTERMRIDTSGNVGIGTSSPSAKLQISATYPNLILDETNTDAAYQQTQFGVDNGSFRIQTRTSTNAFVSNDYLIDKNASGASAHIWRIGNAERMRINSAGSVTMPYQPVGTYTFGGLHTARYVTIHRNIGNHLSTHPSVTAGRTGDFVRFTAPVNGSYAFSISVTALSTSQKLLISMYGNFSPLNMTYNHHEIIDCRRSVALEEAITFSGVIYMSAGDTFEPDIYRAVNSYHDTSAGIRVSIHLIG